jgi:hypothetical protein
MRPPYLLCRHHCPHWGRCEPILRLFTALEEAGSPHPMSLAIRDRCPMFRTPIAN